MKLEGEVRVRDKRRPGHCWQDNELYDAFQPIIGPHAVNVYVHLTRECYDTTVDYSVRRLADATGISKSAVSRNLKVLEHVGMLRLRSGTGSASSSCELLDLKDAAERLGAIYNRKRASFVFTDSVTAKLRAEITELRKSLQSKFDCVPQRDTNFEEKFCSSVSERDTSVPLQAGLCPTDGGSQQYSEQDSILNTTTPPTPSLREGDADRNSDYVDDALDHLASECGFTDERLKKALRKPLQLWMKRNTGRAYDAADAMIAAWREYVELGDLRRSPWSPRKFFVHGHWLDPRSWPLDRALLARRQESRLGC